MTQDINGRNQIDSNQQQSNATCNTTAIINKSTKSNLTRQSTHSNPKRQSIASLPKMEKVTLCEGDKVDITGGKYKGDEGTIVRLAGRMSYDIRLIKTNSPLVCVRRWNVRIKMATLITTETNTKVRATDGNRTMINEQTSNQMSEMVSEIETLQQQMTNLQLQMDHLRVKWSSDGK